MNGWKAAPTAVLLATLATLAVPIAAQLPPPNPAALQVLSSSECVDISGGDNFATNSSPVVQVPCCIGKTGSQVWTMANPSGEGKITGAKGLCLNATGTGDGAKVIVATCVTPSSAGQLWTLRRVVNIGNQLFQIVNRSGKCLEVPGSSTATGVQLTVRTCQSTSGPTLPKNQVFQFNHPPR